MNRHSPSHWLNWVLILAIALGVCFRFINLDRKVFWHDEVYTVMRAAGFTRYDIDQELFQNKIVAAPDLQKFQNIKPGGTAMDTVRSLAMEDPQHPPLYFLMARGWMQMFGSSIAASRALPALLSLLSLPLMYALAMELFAAQLPALLATALIALSPADILFAQTARQYGLLTTAVIASSLLLLRATRIKDWQTWGLYALSLAFGLYVHPFFVLTMVAHGVFLLILSICRTEEEVALQKANPLSTGILGSTPFRWIAGYAGANAIALILYSPWLQVLLGNQARILSTTDWARVTVGLSFLLKLWTLSFTSLFFDLDFGFNNPLTYLARLPFLLLILAALVLVYLRTSRRTWIFLLKTALIPFLILALPDLITGGKRSAVSRYLISCFPSIQLMVAFLLSVGLAGGKPVWRGILAIVFAASILSCSVSAAAETWWVKDLSYSNAEVAQIINADASQGSPLVISDLGDDYTNTGDLISLSYRLKDNVRLYLVKQPSDLNLAVNESRLFVFRPSAQMKIALTQNNWQWEIVSLPGRLWRLKQ